MARRLLAYTEPATTPEMLAQIRSLSRPLRTVADLDPLVDRIAQARYVLLGEASHGTHEYYAWRAALSRRLIEEHGFSFIAVEGDWPDCYRVNSYVKGYPDAGPDAREVLHAFDRWPTWMWANQEVVELAEWLRLYNNSLPESVGRDTVHGPRSTPHAPRSTLHGSFAKVGFYGLDVYSLWDSLYQVLGYLGKHVPSALPAARRAFQCFEPYGESVAEYARGARWVDASCEEQVVALLTELRRKARPTPDDREAHFNAEQNALVVKDAEHYYRTMVHGGPESWNIRDRHMTHTLDRLVRHHGPDSRAIVWAHNTHVGDARFTDMTDDGTVNIGQLVREGHADEGVVLVGFGSYQGSVIAGKEWEAPMERMTVPPGRAGSWEEVLHAVGAENRLLLLDEARAHGDLLQERGHRAIGVVYDPAFERFGNYVPTVLPLRYDAFLYLEETRALEPLHEVQPQIEHEVPETYPSGA